MHVIFLYINKVAKKSLSATQTCRKNWDYIIFKFCCICFIVTVWQYLAYLQVKTFENY